MLRTIASLKVFCDMKNLIEGCSIEKLIEHIFSSFHNSNSELFKIVPENINSMGELDSKPNRTLEVIDSSNKIDGRQKFQKLDSATLNWLLKIWKVKV